MSELGDYQYTYTVDVLCKFCGDKDVVRYGKKGDVQYFMCKVCSRKFADNNAPEQMRYSVDVVGSAINMFYEGLSVRKIQRHLQQDNGSSPSPSMIYNKKDGFVLGAFVNMLYPIDRWVKVPKSLLDIGFGLTYFDDIEEANNE